MVESFRSTESCPRDGTEKPPRLENSPPPARQLTGTSTTTLRLRQPSAARTPNAPGLARQPSGPRQLSAACDLGHLNYNGGRAPLPVEQRRDDAAPLQDQPHRAATGASS